MASNNEYEQQRTWHLGQYLPRHPSDIFISAYVTNANVVNISLTAEQRAEAYAKSERDAWYSADKKQNK